MSKFAKLFDVENVEILEGKISQILVRKGLNAETEAVEVIVSTVVEGVNVDLSLGFKSDEEAEAAFEKFDQDQALAFLSKVMSSFLDGDLDENIDETRTLKQD